MRVISWALLQCGECGGQMRYEDQNWQTGKGIAGCPREGCQTNGKVVEILAQEVPVKEIDDGLV